jgi:hypothetical protein
MLAHASSHNFRPPPRDPLIKAERPFFGNIFFLEWSILVPDVEDESHDDSDSQADKKKPAIGRQPDEQNQDYGNSNHEPRGASQIMLGLSGMGARFHANASKLF